MAPTMTQQSPAAATDVSTGAIPVARGRIRPATANNSQTAANRGTGSGNGVTPV